MKRLFFILVFCSIYNSIAQNKESYLTKNRFDLNSKKFIFPQKNFKIIGFGAYHGSAKTEDVELKLLTSITKNNTLKFYFHEVDNSTAYFYNKYLKTGDTLLLKKLIIHNGFHVTQERTIEMYKKWKNFKRLNDKLPNKIKILGLEWIRNYRFVTKHLLDLVDNKDKKNIPLNEIENMVRLDTTSYALGNLSYAYKKIKSFVTDYENKKEFYAKKITYLDEFNHLINNIKSSFNLKVRRSNIVYNNYLNLNKIYDFKTNLQFLRVGFFHIEKAREGAKSSPSFFARLIENKIYTKEEIISVIGYFTNSRVVWSEVYEKGEYKSFTTEGGYGIGDYEKEYFRGIQHLKNTKISDLTLFKLNRKDSPYLEKTPDLIEIVMKDEESNGKLVKGISTLDFLDYAILISNSKASKPIYEMK